MTPRSYLGTAASTFVLLSTCFAQTGDFDGNGIYDCNDIDALSQAVVSSGDIATYDVTGDGLLSRDDVTRWLGLAGETNLGSGESYVYGDGNLDGVVDASDTDIISSSRYTDTAGYCRGDFDVDGRVDAHDNQVVFANLFTSYETVEGPGSLGIAVPGKSAFYYDPSSGKMWMDTGGDRFNAWAIPTAVAAISRDELSEPFGLFFTFFAQSYFNDEDQWLSRPSQVAGIYQVATYPANLPNSNFGDVEASRVFAPFFDVEFMPIDARLSQVVTATIRTWPNANGNWSDDAWNGQAPSASEIALLDTSSGLVRIGEDATATSIETLVRGGHLRIDGTHNGDVTVYHDDAISPIDVTLSGSGTIDGDLVMMGHFSLSGVDTLSVTGEAILSSGYNSLGETGGASEFVLNANFYLAPGESSGEFAMLRADQGIDGTLPELEAGAEFEAYTLDSVAYTDTEILISITALSVLPGDANRDGAVDVADFNIWNSNKFTEGNNWDSGDFNGDGVTDVSDFNVWNTNKFTGSDAMSVPEPTGQYWAILLLVAGGSLLSRKRD